MAEDTKATEESATEEEFSVVAVPENLIQQVADYVIKLQEEVSDVSGHMISGLGSIRLGGLSAKAGKTWTGCGSWKTGAQGNDVGCTDTD